MNRRVLTALEADECAPCAGFDPRQLPPREATVLPIGQVGVEKNRVYKAVAALCTPAMGKGTPGGEVFLTEMRGHQTGRNR